MCGVVFVMDLMFVRGVWCTVYAVYDVCGVVCVMCLLCVCLLCVV